MNQWQRSGWPKLQRDWKGRRVRTLRPMQNGYVSIPKGKTLTVRRVSNQHNIQLEGDACEHCGVGVFISRVWWGDVELLPDGEI